jgi:hypothetical protein
VSAPAPTVPVKVATLGVFDMVTSAHGSKVGGSCMSGQFLHQVTYTFKTYLALVVMPKFRCRELSRAGGTNGRTTPDIMQPIATARAARVSGRGRWAEK